MEQGMETICSGWLTKSPPDKFVKSFRRVPLPFTQKIIKAKWHRRYFVLHKPAGSLPGDYALDYFNDDSLRRRRGTISLGECERIESSLESSYYQHLFSLRTKHHGKPRLYYLAAESEADMTRWVHYLSSVCGLNPEPVTSEFERSSDDAAAAAAVAGAAAAGDSVDEALDDGVPPPPPMRFDSIPSNEYAPSPERLPSPSGAAPAFAANMRSSPDSESYIPLDECSTGVAGGVHHDAHEQDPIRESYSSCAADVYDTPPTRHSAAAVSLPGEVYDVPPGRDDDRTRNARDRTSGDSLYQVPAVRAPSSRPGRHPQRTDVADSSTSPSAARYRISDAPSSNRDSDMSDYDVLPAAPSGPPSSSGPRPVRPPKPSSVLLLKAASDRLSHQHDAAEPIYEQDVFDGAGQPRDSSAWPDGSTESDDTYDFPRAVTATLDSRLVPSSPPPQCDGGDVTVHRYINASTGVLHSIPAHRPSIAASQSGGSGRPSTGASDNGSGGRLDGDDDDDMYSVPPAPVLVGDGIVRRCASAAAGGAESLYNSPKPLAAVQGQPRRSASVNPGGGAQPARPPKPSKLRETHIGSVPAAEDDGTYAQPSGRVSLVYSKQSSRPADTIALPVKAGNGNDGSDSSNDEDDVDGPDSTSSSGEEREEPLYQSPRPTNAAAATGAKSAAATAAAKSAAATAAAKSASAAPPSNAGGVEYLDIAHDTLGHESHSPLPSRSASFGNQAGIGGGAGGGSATEYTDIDRVKTKALETTKKDIEARKGSEKE